MSNELNDRGRAILEAIVDDYIVSGEPVGSRAVTKRHNMDISPATVRNVMSDLEDMGFLISPHTSAGRVPTDKGYQYYVDTLLQIRDLSELEKQTIDSHYHGKKGTVESLLQETGKALSSLSNYAGVVMVPRFTSTVFRHIEFVRLSDGKALVVFVSQTGMVQNKLIDLDKEISQRDLEKMTNYLNRKLSGMTIQEVKKVIAEEMKQEKALYDKLMKKALELSGAALAEDIEGQLFIEGASSFLELPDFAEVGKMKRLFQAFEQKNHLIELLDKSQEASGVQIFIGSANSYNQIEGCSLVTSSYQNVHGTIGTLGVIGPNRMSYSKVIPIVDYTARLVSRLLETGLGKEK
ncbi:MAG: heat-inducible transcription repressor HrcA [Desulfuromonas sp.]|nr:MAG: heat-inducible transcription repressor HrcA [Desulfuromonas sp.]